MPDRFLSARTRTRTGAPLGRIFSVVRQTWRITDDPRRTGPRESVLATRRTAGAAADLARDAAIAFGRHGFHKPSGAWWGAEDEEFHRFVIAPARKRRWPALLVGVGVVALAAALRPKPKA